MIHATLMSPTKFTNLKKKKIFDGSTFCMEILKSSCLVIRSRSLNTWKKSEDKNAKYYVKNHFKLLFL